MTDKLITALIIAGLLTGCSRGVTRANQKDYEVVEEGSASGVTSTIAGPGETLPPITNTNADTTTAFNLDTNAVPAGPASTQPGTIAGTLPPAYTPAPITQTQPPIVIRRQPPPQAQPQPVPEPTTAPPTQTDTAEEPEEPEPATDTATTTQPPPPEKKEEAPPTDTSTTTAPPPPPPF